jgi:hypothetical protein
MRARGFETKLQWRNQWDKAPHLNNDWTPDKRVRSLLQQRIRERMPKNPRWTKK